MFFRVNVPISGFVSYEVEALSAEDAKNAVLKGCGEYLSNCSETNEDTDANGWYAYKIIKD